MVASADYTVCIVNHKHQQVTAGYILFHNSLYSESHASEGYILFDNSLYSESHASEGYTIS